MKRLKNLKELFGKLLLNNWPEKVICLAIALFLFLFFRINSLESKTFFVPLKVENTESLTPSLAYLDAVRVSLRGERNSIYSILEEDVISYIDASLAVEEGEFTAPVKIRLTGTAAAVDMLEVTVDPPEVTLMLEQRVSKILPISPVLTGFPGEGYAFDSCVLNPSSLEVSGPRAAIEVLSELKTEPISVSGLNSSADGAVAVIIPSSLVSLSDSERISYRVYVSPEISQRSLEEVSIVYGPLASDLEIESATTTANLVISGPSPELSRWRPHPSLLFVSCEGITRAGRYALDIRVNIPNEFSVVTLEPQEASVLIIERSEE